MDRGGQRGDGLREDDGQNTGHVDLDGQVGVLAAVDLAAHDALGVLYGDAALGVVDEHDQDDQSEHAQEDEQILPPVVEGVGDHVGDDGADAGGNAGDDVGKQDHGDAVADAEFRDLLAQPHDEGGAGGERQNDDEHVGENLIVGQHVGVAEHGIVGCAHDEADAHGGVAGDLVDLLAAFLAALLAQALQGGDGDGQQLDDDGCVDIGLDGQRQHGGAGERRAGQHVVQAQDVVGQVLREVLGEGRDIDVGNGDRVADAVNQKDQQDEQQLFAQFGDFPGVTQCV